jgi:hypothetical protein
MRTASVSLVCLLVSMAALQTLAQTSWFLTEIYSIPSDCTDPQRVKAYVAYRADQCFPLDAVVVGRPGYAKYSCASDGYTAASCYDSGCTNCTAGATKVPFDACKAQSGLGTDYFTTRCGALPAGAEGLSVISYTDNSTLETIFNRPERVKYAV